ncbi:Aldo/keto reductase [Coprinopsis marcescibilis]|uniref:Aldo/keto reductase n=1 Tax=Coprinopsis marcescibilis TaxID=230819 RepID=A0A5C3KU47_COPMA|nr:Aldo/keto reductase [Coprinopsis marcescibilis]
MSLLGFGVYQNYTTTPSVLEALKVGYRHIDSAQAYKNEAAVAQAIREYGIDRTDVFVTTKIISSHHGYASTLKAVDESLQRMQFDYVDLFLIHNPHSGKEKRLETYKALLEARDAGKIRSVGVSNYGVHHLEEIREAGLESPTVNQIELHPFCQQTPIVQYCQSNRIVVQAYCPIVRAQNNYHPVLVELAAKHGNRDPAQILLRWSLQKGYVPLPKSANPVRIQSNANIYDFTLSLEDMGKLDALDKAKDGAVSWNPVDTP